MKLFLDGKQWEPVEEYGSRDELLELARRSVMDKGRVVSAISIDGNEIDEEGFKSSGTGTEIAFTSSSVRDLLTESVAEAAVYMPRLCGGLTHVADTIEAGKTPEALGTLKLAVEGIDWFLAILQRSCSILGMHDTLGVKIEELCISLSESLDSASEKLADGEHLMLAYHIRENLIPVLSRFDEVVQALKAATEGQVQ